MGTPGRDSARERAERNEVEGAFTTKLDKDSPASTRRVSPASMNRGEPPRPVPQFTGDFTDISAADAATTADWRSTIRKATGNEFGKHPVDVMMAKYDKDANGRFSTKECAPMW